MANRFEIVDVFAQRKYAGNQLAVVHDADKLTDNEMQQIAQEMNYSETTFIEGREKKKGGYDVRIFTPEAEIPFAGHPTLGTAYVIRRAYDEGDKITLNLGVGQIPVEIEERSGRNVLWMEQKSPTFGSEHDAEDLANVLGLNTSDINTEYPIQEVSTGLPTIVVPLRSLDAVKRAEVNRKEYYDLVEKTEAKLILVFCDETYDEKNDLNVRVFADYYGVPEDPATGSSNGCLAGYLSEYGFLGGHEVDVRVEQGLEINRPSLLYLRARKGDEVEVNVGGSVIPVAEGNLI
ncbi:MAG: PhzF family phenazine biosynthesis protein [Halobacteria archaeon]|nr:PhzF family phenazine biosynthesis protein [Halobacteria archaeon]